MSSLMSFEIRLSDIWIECQKELIEMNDKIIELNHCLIVWQKICKHLEQSNETLVAIVERCPVIDKKEEIHVFINRLQREEEYMKKEKENLKTFDTKFKFNEQKVFELMAKWKGCQSMTTSSTQTEDNDIQDKEMCFENELILIPKPETNELVNGLNEDNNRLVVDETSDVSNDEDFAVDDGMDVDDSDSEFEISSKNKKKKLITKSKEKIILNDKAILEMKVNDNYVCNQTNCEYKSKVRKNFLKHFRRHFAAMKIIVEYPIKRTEGLNPLSKSVDECKVNGKYVCSQTNCEYQSKIRKNFFKHFRRHFNSEKTKRIHSSEIKVHDIYSCNECQFSCDDKYLFDSHIKSHLSPESDVETNEGHKRLTNGSVDECKVDGKYVCNQTNCKYESNIRKNFSKHFRRHFPSVPTVKVNDQYVCTKTDCLFTSGDINLLNAHIDSHQSSDGKASLPKIFTLDMIKECKGDGKYVCNRTDCKFESKVRQTFLKHFGGHFGANAIYKTPYNTIDKIDTINETVLPFEVDDRYVCNRNDCQFSCVESDVFYSHLKQRHNHYLKGALNKRTQVCSWPGCGKVLMDKRKLRKHMSIHRNDRRFPCDWPGCDYKTYSNSEVRTHRLIHTNEKRRECSWPGCTFRCNVSWSMVAHQRTHTKEKPYACPWPDCTFRCSQSCSLIPHKRIHTGEKPYVCEVEGCDKRFPSLAGIFTHRKSHNKY